MTAPLFIDFETRSVVDLKLFGLYNYSRDPSTDVMCVGFSLGDASPLVVYNPRDIAPLVRQHINSRGTVVAHNAGFELAIWNEICVPRYGWPKLEPEQVVCTMALCYAMSLPGALENAASALGLRVRKDDEGRALMLRMTRPVNKAKLDNGSTTTPIWLQDSAGFKFREQKLTGSQALIRLGEYCKTDVEIEREIYKRCMPLSAFERKVWCMDYRINQRGVLFDPPAVTAALAIKEKVLAGLDERMKQVTDGWVGACSQIGALKKWLNDHGVYEDSLAKAELGELLGNEDLPPVIKEALLLRQEAGRATSVAKLDAIRRLAGPDGRMRNIVQYHGAGTGRWAGRGIQPHNFPRDLPKPQQVEEIMALVKAGDIDALDFFHGAPLAVISKLLRGFIVAPPGRMLVGGDYANVEGRGIAWLAGEQWKLDAFMKCDANPDGPDIYEMSYAETFHVDVSQVDEKQRQVGKVIELACGYQGHVGAFQQMAKTYGVVVDDEVAASAANAWRDAHQGIVAYWKALQNAAMWAVEHPGEVTTAGAVYAQVKFKVSGSFLWMLLPSGRALCYPYPRIMWLPVKGWESNTDDGEEPPKRPALTYKSVPSADDFKRGRVVEDKTNSRQWARMSTYGGKLAENATQAICRDLLADPMVRLEAAGHEVVLHVHDEIVCEGPYAKVEGVQRIMNTLPPWAQGFPLKADCWLAARYQK